LYKVYLAIPRGLDKLLGYVREDGSVYRSKVGLDDRLGRVDLSSGKIYADRLGPDKKIGHVDLRSGKVYLSQLGPDRYVGKVGVDGRMHQHVPMASDNYIGNIDRFVSYAHSAGAMLLLVLPAIESKSEGAESEQEGDVSE